MVVTHIVLARRVRASRRDLPAPNGIPLPAGTPFPGPAVNPLLSSPATGGGPSTVTLTIDSPLRMTRPSVRFCWTDGAGSVELESFDFLPYEAKLSMPSRTIQSRSFGQEPTLTVLNSSHSARTKFMCLS